MTHAHHDTHTGEGERLDQASSALATPTDHSTHADHHAGHHEAGHGGGHIGGHTGHGGHGDHAAQFRDRFWWSLLLAAAGRGVQPDVRRPARLHAAGRNRLDLPGARHGRLLLRRLAVPHRGRRRAAVPPARDDAAGRHGDHRGVRRQRPDLARHRRFRPGLLVGARAPGRDHAARALAGDAGPRPGLQRPRRAGRAAARPGRPGAPRRGGRGGQPRRARARRRRARPLRRPGPGRRDRRRRRSRGRRVDDHRRVPAGAQDRRGPGGGRHRGHRLRAAGPGQRRRRGHRAGRYPPAGRAGPGLPLPGPGAGRPGRSAAVLLRHRRRA